jgi:uncharacterized Zn finger protein (UPF0148 family)
MQNTIKCPVCGSDLDFELNGVEKKIKRISFPPNISRSQFYMNIIYLLIGAILALAGVSLPSCTDLEVVCPECDTMDGSEENDSDSATDEPLETESAKLLETDKDTATDNRFKPDTGSDERAGDTATDEQLESDSATDEQLEGDTETHTSIVSLITADCEAMKEFFSDCYWSEENFTGPTYSQITAECSLGNTITESLAQWHACWELKEESCTCPPGAAAADFECQPNKCQQWTTCMTTCRL